MKTLDQLSFGEKGIVRKIGSRGVLRRRMIDMGITFGTEIEMVKSAPLGDPIEVLVHGYKLSIRNSEAKEIELFDNEEEFKEFNSMSENYPYNSKECILLKSGKQDSEKKIYRAALIGNPNSGKTTLFNQLTGSYEYVGNWPGVTVERKEGKIKNIGDNIKLVDLPGVYSLSPYSPEEVVTRNYIMQESPDIIIDIVDATNLERNLYLTTQLLELNCKIILVLNMSDLLRRKGKEINCKELEKRLGIPVIAISAGKNRGINKLLEILSLNVKKCDTTRYISKIYSDKVENSIEEISEIIEKRNTYTVNKRFKAIKILEGDSLILDECRISEENIKRINDIREHISKKLKKEEDIIIPEERYTYINYVCRQAVINIGTNNKISISEKIDSILTAKYTAIPCFLSFIFLIFYVTFGPFGVMLKNLCEQFIDVQVYGTISKILNYARASDWIKSLVLDAIIKGVGGVVSFLPQIVLLFTLLSILEDCGYMARTAFIMDKPMRKIGLSGKAFVPLIMGFGCSVPAIMGTKILENKKDKNLTMFLIPFMSCSAKMPLYLLFASSLFSGYETIVILSIYIFGVLCACLTAYLFKDSIFKGEESPFIMEIPDYKLPSYKNIKLSVSERTKDFIERAGTVILIATIVVWILQYFNLGFKHVSDNSQSILAKIGELISPIFNICGFGDWRVAVSLVTGLMAKESIVSTLSVLYSDEGFRQAFNFANGISFLIFTLLYTPCIAAVSAIYREYENKKFAIFSVIYQMLIAYVLSGIAYQIIKLFSVFFK